MKSLASFDQDLGGDGAKVKGEVGIEGQSLQALIAVSYPLEKIVEPLMGVVDGIIDKIEDLIPGDQKTLAAGLKTDARKQLLDLLSEQA